MKINEFAQSAHDLAKEKGWHDSPRTPLEIHMLVVSEIAEATECVRNGEPALYQRNVTGEVWFPESGEVQRITDPEKFNLFNGKPEGEAVELADAVIRVMDYFVSQGWDLEATLRLKHEYNKSRSYRHGGKRL